MTETTGHHRRATGGLAGIIISPFALGWTGLPDRVLVELFHGDPAAADGAIDLVLEILAELGVIVLLFFVGLETRVADLLSVGKRSAVVGTLGIMFPFAGGYLVMQSLANPTLELLFVGVALVVTSTGITACVLVGRPASTVCDVPPAPTPGHPGRRPAYGVHPDACPRCRTDLLRGGVARHRFRLSDVPPDNGGY